MTKKEIETKFIEGMFDEHTPSGKISVSSIVYPCLRKAYYTKQFGEFFDIKTAYDFWLGKAVHKMDFLEKGEIELEWEGILGRIDEYENGTLVEKKTAKELPSTAYAHHITQAEYYYVLCLKNGMPVDNIYLLYMEKKYPAWKFFEVKPREVEIIEEEMLKRKEVLEEALKNKKMPVRNIGWLCNYCQFSPKCFTKETKEK